MPKTFFKKHWYLIITGILTLILIIFIIIGFFGHVHKFKDYIPQTNCISNEGSNPFITSIEISSKDKEGFKYYCSTGYSRFPICDENGDCTLTNINGDGTPYTQICHKNNTTVCDQTQVITDIKFVDMTDSNGAYKPEQSRCCDIGDLNCTYSAPLSINLDNPNQASVGMIPNSIENCRKMGLCTQRRMLSDIRNDGGTYLPSQNIKFVQTSSTTSKEDICKNFPGYTTDGVNLYNGCDTKDAMYICKKYEKL